VSPRARLSFTVTAAFLVAAVVTAGVLLHRASASRAAQEPVLRVANEGISDLYTLDPARGPDFNARQAMQLIYGGLVRFGVGFHIQPDAAARWTVSADKRTYTFYLRPHVRFADGRLLTASDVAYSLNRTLLPKFAVNSVLLDDIDGASAVQSGRAARARGIQVLNARTIRIHLQRPSGSFLAKLANPVGYIVPSWRIQADPQHWDQHAIGTGPFAVSRWIHNTALLLKPNHFYYGGRLRLGGVYMPFFPEPLAAYKSYRSGGVDIMGTVHFPTEVLYDVQGRTDFHRSPRLETVFLTLNERQPPFNDARIRLAFAHAVDRAALAHDAYGGFAHATDAMMPPGLPGYNRGLKGAGFNPDLARHLLAAAGYPDGRGLPAIVYPVDQDAQSVVLATALARQWRHVLGVRVRLKQYTHTGYLSLLQHLHYQIAVIDWTDDFPDPENFISQQLRTGSPNNNGGWSNRTFDQLTARADTMLPQNRTRFLLYQRAEAIAMNGAATIPLVNPNAGILMRGSVRGLSISGGYLLARDWTRVTVTGN
jgi:oligopeptide transport system substrate-binding protein